MRTLLPLIYIVLTLQACTVYRVIEVTPFKKQVNSYVGKLWEAEAKMKENQENMNQIISEVEKSDISKKKIILSQLQNVVVNCQTIQKEYVGHRNNFHREYESLPIEGKNEVKSTQPEYQEVVSFSESLEQKNKDLNQYIDRYRAESSKFQGVLNSHGITYIEADKVKSQFDHQLVSFNSQESLVKKGINEFEDKVRSHNFENKTIVLEKIKKLRTYLIDIQIAKGPLKNAVIRFDRKYKNSKKVIYGPGSFIKKGLDQINQRNQELQVSINGFNSTVSEINSLLPKQEE